MTIGIQRIAEASSEVSEQTNHVSTRLSIGNQDINELSNQILQVKDVMLQTSSKNIKKGILLFMQNPFPSILLS
ncbi:hypothetical protein ACIQY5_07060 [Peribacillus frigoritolerans]|uniref:hypothetical protein n=1 Tax=Peribacillus frigoritolerans TaxID=450367 RepID=UPI0037F53F6A